MSGNRHGAPLAAGCGAEPDTAACRWPDTAGGELSPQCLAAFLQACAEPAHDPAACAALALALAEGAPPLAWPNRRVLDHRSLRRWPHGGVAPIAVAIVAAAGNCMPCLAPRAGADAAAEAADIMATMAPLDLDKRAIERTVQREGGCLFAAAPPTVSRADALIARLPEADVAGETGALRTALALGRCRAAGASHVVLDLAGHAAVPEPCLSALAQALALDISVLCLEDGALGGGLGPALEAQDVLRVLRRREDASPTLCEHALDVAGMLLDLDPNCAVGGGRAWARGLLASGAALRKFHAICEAQGGFREPPVAAFRQPLLASGDATVASLGRAALIRLARLAGAPAAPAAGVALAVRAGERVVRGQPLLHVHAETAAALQRALGAEALQREAVPLAPA